MIRNPARVHAFRERLELFEEIEIDGIRAAHVERNAVQNYRISLGHLIEYVQRAAARIHVVFRKYLEPIDGWIVFEDVLEVHRAQTDSESQIRITPPIVRHYFESPVLPFSPSHLLKK